MLWIGSLCDTVYGTLQGGWFPEDVGTIADILRHHRRCGPHPTVVMAIK